MNPGAMQLTVMPNGPSSFAICRVNPITPALALVYAWIPVLLTVRPAADEMLTIRPQRRSVLVGAIHGGPAVAERLGDGGADAVRGTGHDRGLARHWPGHRVQPFSSRVRTSATPAAQMAC